MMNKKKAALLLAGIEAFLTALLSVLYLNHIVTINMFIALLSVVCVVTSALIVIVIRKIN